MSNAKTASPEAAIARLVNAAGKVDAALDELDDLGGLNSAALEPKAKRRIRATLNELLITIRATLNPQPEKAR